MLLIFEIRNLCERATTEMTRPSAQNILLRHGLGVTQRKKELRLLLAVRDMDYYSRLVWFCLIHLLRPSRLDGSGFEAGWGL
jgi:hypothetical protein